MKRFYSMPFKPISITGLCMLLFCTLGAQRAEVIDFPSAMVYYENGKGPYLLHQFKKGETLYGLKKLYGLVLEDLYEINPDMRPEEIKKGALIKIPLEDKNIESRIQKLEDDKYYAALYYTARPGETLFSIGRRMFGVSVRHLQQNNVFEKGSLQDGQTLFVGWIETHPYGPRAATASVNEQPDDVQHRSEETVEIKSGEEVMKAMPEQSGVAYWHKERKEAGGYFVLHKSAPQGSYVEIENPMFDKTIRAKVIGNLPPNTYPNEVLVVVSPAIAKSLGALDSRFYVKIRYLQTGIFPVKHE